MQPRLAALQPPVLTDRGLGQGAAGFDRQHGERPQRLLLRRHRRVEPLLRITSLRKVVRPLEILATGDHQLAPIPQCVEHHLRRLPVPHAAGTVTAPFEVPRAERALGPDALEHGLDKLAVLAHRDVMTPPMAAALHHSAKVRPQLDRQQRRLVRPVLEDPPLAKQALDRPVRDGSDARRQRQPVRAIDGRDRVELHRRQAPDRRLDLDRPSPSEPRRELLLRHDEPPQRGELLSRDGRDSRAGRSV